MRKLLCLFLVLWLLPVQTGCASESGTQAKEQPATVGVLLKSMEHQHWLDVRSGLLAAAGAGGVETVVLYPPTESDMDQQRAMFLDLLQSEPDLILYAPCDSRSSASLVAAAKEKGIPVLAVDTRTEDVALPYIGADNTYMGVLAAQRMALLMEGEGQVAIISGVEEQSSHTERVAGFCRGLEEYPGMEVVAVKNADSDFGKAMACADAIMGEHPEVKGIFCTSAVMGLGAVEQKKLQFYPSEPFLVATDTQDDALTAVENGALNGLVSQDGYEVGYKAMQTALRVLAGAEPPAETFISTKMLTRENVQEYREGLQTEREGVR